PLPLRSGGRAGEGGLEATLIEREAPSPWPPMIPALPLPRSLRLRPLARGGGGPIHRPAFRLALARPTRPRGIGGGTGLTAHRPRPTGHRRQTGAAFERHAGAAFGRSKRPRRGLHPPPGGYASTPAG